MKQTKQKLPAKVEEQVEFGEITIPNQVYVSLIPTIANSVLVKYDPEIQVSCVIPPREYDVVYNVKHEKAAKKTIKVKSPTLIMSCGYGDVPTPTSYKTVAHGYGLYVIDESRKKEIWAKPYLLANVWDRGQICFGSLIPGSLRQAFNYYWTSNFNADLLRSPHKCTKKSHYYDYHFGCYCSKMQIHQCACGEEIFHGHYGCGCSTVAKSKKCKGNCGDSDTSYTEQCSCCLAIKALVDGAIKKDPKLSKKKISSLIKTEKLSCGCGKRHKKSCECRKRACDCPCECACCRKVCEHDACKCRCCLNTCSCHCNCTNLQRLSSHLTNYHDTVLKEQAWTNYTATFCGTKYWAAPKGAEGVLISNNKHLLNNIPREFWRKDRLGGPLVICLANKNGNSWRFESGGYAFSLNEKFVITK